MPDNTVYAETVNYWQTSQSSADTWIERAKKEITSIGGRILGDLVGTDMKGVTVFRLDFQIGPDQFKIVWPALPSKTGKDKAAKVQAATLLYHDVKHKVVMAKVKGVRTAFLEYYLLPNGQTASDVAGDSEAFLRDVPDLMMINSGKR
jgi:hypothetical protein